MASVSSNPQALSVRRIRTDRLTVDLPVGVLTALKVHAAQHDVTIREVVTSLIQQTLKQENNHE